MTITVRTSLHSLYLLLVILFTSSCSQLPSSSTNQDSEREAELWDVLAVAWPEQENAAAADYIQSCQTDYELASQQFVRLELNPPRSDADFLDAINEFDITFDRTIGRSSLFANVHPEESVRDAADFCQQSLIKIYSEVSLSQPIYQRLKRVKRAGLDELTDRYIEKMLKGYELSGVNQSEKVRARIRELNDELLKVGQEFSKNIRMDVREVLMDETDLDGLPADYIEAHPVDANGKVKITTEYPDYLPFMQYAHSDEAKKRLYIEFRQRGYPANKDVLTTMLKKRYEYAQLMDFPSYAHYVTDDKMIENPQNAWDFINKINNIAKPRSDADNALLLERLKQIDPTATRVEDWQKTYLENLLKTEVYSVDSQVIRQYFSYKNVRDGIFRLMEDLFDVQIKPWDTTTWHESVESYAMWDGERLIGQFYLDMHPRAGKYGHAAAFSVQEGVKGVQPPIKALVCNFPGGDGSVGLLEHSQVETFLHEFGHLIHGLFSGDLPWLGLAGISNERDFVEAPSQMLEEWVWDEETLKIFAKNQRGETIPNDLIESMNSARDFGKGIFTRHQMFYAAMSLAFHDQDPATLDLDQTMINLQNEYSPFPFVDDTYMYTSFGHLYGYSAIYYTYMWSLVIASDMFSEFEAHGLRNPEVADRYRQTVLSAGSSKPAAELVEDFLGREYRFDAFAESLTVPAGQE